jgi:hypothetical protein
MVIRQIRVSKTITFFKTMIMNKYNLVDYNDISVPAFFFGVYTDTDIDAIKKHAGMKVIIWSGTDIDYLNNKKVVPFVKELKKLKNIYHISNSEFINNDLTHFKMPYKFIPVCGIDVTKFKPLKKSNCIYIYTSATSPLKYGSMIYMQVIKKLPQFKFIIASNSTSYNNAKTKNKLDKQIQNIKSDKVIDLYKQCFIGLRLTEHDGISYTVVELGLCGIRCIHNGNQPNVIKYQSVDDVVNIIKKESRRINMEHITVRNNMLQWLNISNDWKTDGYYK